MRSKTISLLLVIFAGLLPLLALSGCGRYFDSTTILGSSGEVIVVMEKSDWEGALGQSVRNALDSPVDFLDPAEKKFKLTFIQQGSLSRQIQMNRNIVLFRIGEDVDSSAVLYRKDVWAHPQIVVQINARTASEACKIVAAEADAIYRKIELAEINRNVEKCYKYEIASITKKIEAFAGGSPRIPDTGYRVASEAQDFVWVNKASQYITSGIVVTAYPAARDGKDLDPDRITRNLRKQINAHVPGGPDGSFMDVDEDIVPLVSDLNVNGRAIKQIRSRWMIQGDSMGGPYVSHSFLSPDGSRVVTMMAFLFCQRYDNRIYFRQAESILYSFKWAGE